MSIQGDVIELQSIKHEIKCLHARIRALRKKATEVEKRINSFLEEKGQPGVKYKGTAIIRETKEKRVRKTNAERESDSIHVLRQYGIHNPQEVLNELMEARKGRCETSTTLKFKKLKR